MPASWPLFAVIGSALVYTIAALCTKRALSGGATVWQVNFAANMAMAVLYLPFWLGVDFPRLLAQGYKPIVAAITFFIGQLFTFAALRKGDVSVATPLLGRKIPMVQIRAASHHLIPTASPNRTLVRKATNMTFAELPVRNGEPKDGRDTPVRPQLIP